MSGLAIGVLSKLGAAAATHGYRHLKDRRGWIPTLAKEAAAASGIYSTKEVESWLRERLTLPRLAEASEQSLAHATTSLLLRKRGSPAVGPRVAASAAADVVSRAVMFLAESSPDPSDRLAVAALVQLGAVARETGGIRSMLQQILDAQTLQDEDLLTIESSVRSLLRQEERNDSLVDVLFVEDASWQTEPIIVELRARGYRAEVASSVSDARSLMRTFTIRALVVDLYLPGEKLSTLLKGDPAALSQALARDPAPDGVPFLQEIAESGFKGHVLVWSAAPHLVPESTRYRRLSKLDVPPDQVLDILLGLIAS